MSTTVAAVPRLARAVEAIVGNGLGAGIYRRWVASLRLVGDEEVLDVGTGAGACARYLAAAVPEGRVTCLDIDARWLDVARHRLQRHASRTEFVTADISTWSRPAAFDAATMHFVLHDIPESRRDPVLANIARSLKPGGILFVREPVTHGMTAEEMHRRLGQAGFDRVRAPVSARVPLMGPTTSEVWGV